MSKDKKNRKILVFCILIAIFILIIMISKMSNNTYATKESSEKLENDIKISNADSIDIDKIINENTKSKCNREEIETYEEELEYLTQYRNNEELYKGTTCIAQEGRNGTQKITIKRTYDENNNLINEERVKAIITKASLNKIIDVGTKIYVEPKVNKSVTKNIEFTIPLNKPSGLSLEQFEKVLTDSKDKNKVFQNNAKYFYYIEKEYNINGLFVAAVGIHESAWGTSKIASKKYNLFGYGAYDSNPYNGAYNFESYSESIDLIARVFTKYYINPSGTKIYDNSLASGKYYKGNSIEAVGKSYATDKEWANKVYTQMKYLYSKIN